jgi:hypothetical protein
MSCQSAVSQVRPCPLGPATGWLAGRGSLPGPAAGPARQPEGQPGGEVSGRGDDKPRGRPAPLIPKPIAPTPPHAQKSDTARTHREPGRRRLSWRAAAAAGLSSQAVGRTMHNEMEVPAPAATAAASSAGVQGDQQQWGLPLTLPPHGDGETALEQEQLINQTVRAR